MRVNYALIVSRSFPKRARYDTFHCPGFKMKYLVHDVYVIAMEMRHRFEGDRAGIRRGNRYVYNLGMVVSFMDFDTKGEGSKRVCQFVISLVTRIAVLVITFPRYLYKQKVDRKQKMKSHVTVTEYKASTDKIPFSSC
uniref:Uncharacterized protein n=1 Tax=Magallana gigas TaxID=29159 RepID=K1R084_MAGGI